MKNGLRFAVISFVIGLSILISPTLADAANERPCAKPSDIEPEGAITHRFEGQDATVFLDSIQPSMNTSSSRNYVMVLSGPDVFGGIVALVGTKECLSGRKFLNFIELRNALQMVERQRAGRTVSIAGLEREAARGDAEAELHLGMRRELEYRGSGRQLLTRAAEQNIGLAIVALGYGVSGLDFALVKERGVWRSTDPAADQPLGYCWLRVGTLLRDEELRRASRQFLRDLAVRMSDQEKAKGEELWANARKNLAHPACR